MITAIIGKKIKQTQHFNEKGERIPITVIEAGPCDITQIKNLKRDGYNAIQLGFGIRKEKNIKKPILGHIKKAGIKKLPRFLKEVRLKDTENISHKEGDTVKIGEVLSIGDTVEVTGISRGKGFTGVVKRHHFKGGPRTHGQSDRERAPGSIGQTTTPGRVYKGKRMAGRSGGEKVTVDNLKVIEVDNEKNLLVVSGLVPGSKNSLIIVSKVV